MSTPQSSHSNNSTNLLTNANKKPPIPQFLWLIQVNFLLSIRQKDHRVWYGLNAYSHKRSLDSRVWNQSAVQSFPRKSEQWVCQRQTVCQITVKKVEQTLWHNHIHSRQQVLRRPDFGPYWPDWRHSAPTVQVKLHFCCKPTFCERFTHYRSSFGTFGLGG
jgi:hypothetical protein